MAPPSTMPAVRFLDLSVSQPQRAELLAAVERVLAHGKLIIGPEVEELEGKLAARVGRRFAVGVGSGTDALYLALRAADIGPGDEVITTSMSWIATANAIALVGATPVFADVREDLNIDPASAAGLITNKTRAILPVHNQGKPCAMDELVEICRQRKLLLIEDCAQAFDAEYKGRKVGAFGDLACLSMNPMKVLAALGEAGMVFTDSVEWRDKLHALRYNGTLNREDCHWPSHNGRLDTIQAAMLLCRLDQLDACLARRRQIAEIYSRGLVDLTGQLEIPREEQHPPAEPGAQTGGTHRGSRDVYYTYTIRTARRDELMRHLEDHGIESRVRHPILMPCHTAYRDAARGSWTRAERWVKEILCLPVHEKLTDEQAHYVVRCVREFFDGARKVKR
ncbi:MAG: DegT/DnrJ/EryC1/StrS family aminotransferase [Phycisphaeraceae bacterium]|nr:DegT/DnrJ/EryC1/StrS family aminotransferase [Phycisphaeraceae bacterium]